MRSRLVQVQLAVFAIVAICAVGYTGYAYGGFQRYTGIGTYTVTADLADAGGLYPNALVTYRGVDVGVVTGLDAGVNGATARLQIKSDNHIPANSQAYVRSVSAAGEQFIDWCPPTQADRTWPTAPVFSRATPTFRSRPPRSSRKSTGSSKRSRRTRCALLSTSRRWR